MYRIMKAVILFLSLGLMTSANAVLIGNCRSLELEVNVIRMDDADYYLKNGTYYLQVLKHGEPAYFIYEGYPMLAGGRKIPLSSHASIMIKKDGTKYGSFVFTSTASDPAVNTNKPLWRMSISQDSETATIVSIFKSDYVSLSRGLRCDPGVYKTLQRFMRY